MTPACASERRIAINAVAQAARLCRAVQSEIYAENLTKKDKSPVTVADFGSQAVVCRLLCDHFPGDPIVAEEDAADLRLNENAHLLESTLRQVQSLYSEADVDALCRWIDLGGLSK